MVLRYIILTILLFLSSFISAQDIIDSLNKKIEKTVNYSVKIDLQLQKSKIFFQTDDYMNFNNSIIIVKDIMNSADFKHKKNAYNQLISFYKEIELYDSLVITYNYLADLYLSNNDTSNYIKNKNREAYYSTFLGNQKKAINILFDNIRIAEKRNDSSLLTEIHMYLGFSIRTTDFEKAKDYFEKSLEYNNDTLSVFYSTCLNEIGNLYTNLGQAEKAIPYLQKALDIRKKTNDENITYSYNDIAYAYAELGKFYDAILYMSKCIDIEKNTGSAWDLVYSYSAIGHFYMKANKLSNAEKYLNISLEIAEELNLNPVYKEVYNNLYQLYKEKNDFKTSLYYYELSEFYEDTIYENNLAEQIAELEKKYHNEKQEAKLKLMKKEKLANNAIIQRQRVLGMGIILVMLLLAGIAFSVYKSRQKEKRANEKLLMQNEEIQQQNEKIEENAKKLKLANKKIADKNVYITDNIKYARKIQKAMLPSEGEMKNIIPENFIIYKPKDIVSGDFYTVKKINNKTVFVVADCTGHGVSGAFMSILGMSLINDIVIKESILNPADVLNVLRERVKISLRQNKQYTEATDGIDIAFCVYDNITNQLQFSGAQISLFIARDNNITELNADMMPVGVSIGDEKPFKLKSVSLKKNETIYLFTDGYPDQFGGKSGKKLMMANVLKILTEIHDKPMNIQKNYIEAKLKNWQANYKQVDDILFAGFRLNS